jgi:hypothetical protein
MKLRTPITLALLVAAIAAPTALPASSPDAFERAVNRHIAAMPTALERADAHYTTLSAGLGTTPSALDRRSPDTRDAALQAQLTAPSDGRSPDTRDAALQAQLTAPSKGLSLDTLDPGIAAAIRAHQSSLTPADGRSPDTADATLVAHSPVVTLTTPSGFAWREFAIGASAMLGLLLLLGGLSRAGHALRAKRVHPSPA